jgi:hypothetical protein
MMAKLGEACDIDPHLWQVQSAVLEALVYFSTDDKYFDKINLRIRHLITQFVLEVRLLIDDSFKKQE